MDVVAVLQIFLDILLMCKHMKRRHCKH